MADILLNKFKLVEHNKLIDILKIKTFGSDWALKEVEQAIAYCNPEHYEIMLDYKEYKIPGSMIASIHNMSIFLEKDDQMYEAFGCLFNAINYYPKYCKKNKYLSSGEALYFSFALQWYAQKAKSIPPNKNFRGRKNSSLYTPYFNLSKKKNDSFILGYAGSIRYKLKPTSPKNVVENGK